MYFNLRLKVKLEVQNAVRKIFQPKYCHKYTAQFKVYENTYSILLRQLFFVQNTYIYIFKTKIICRLYIFVDLKTETNV